MRSTIFHLGEKEVILLITGELPPERRQRAIEHLARCRKCSELKSTLTRTLDRVTNYTSRLSLPPSADRQSSFRLRVAKAIAKPRVDTGSRRGQSKPARKVRRERIKFALMNPVLSAGLVLAFASTVCIFVWLYQSRPGITSSELLVHAEAWDTTAGQHAGVIRQQVSVRTRRHFLERAIFRDVAGQRVLKPRQMGQAERDLKTRLSTAGVEWDNPLSATAYRDWHDGQRVKKDEITRNGGHVLVLTTTIPSGVVASQSITVRDTDFHPLSRTVAFRDNELVEIAELDYQIIPWAKVDTSLFMPLGGGPMEIAGDSRRVLPLQQASSMISESEIDEAELGVRLVLNKLQADTGEQIQITRDPSGVAVSGLVKTNERRQEIVNGLRFLDHVHVSNLSVEDRLDRTTVPQTSAARATVTQVSTRTSPLETYFMSQGYEAAQLRTFSQELLAAALTASLESRALTDLREHFASDRKLTYLADATLSELIFSHRQRLSIALEREQDLIDKTFPHMDHRTQVPFNDATQPLVALADRNLNLCEELTLGSSSEARAAQPILADLQESLSQLYGSAHALQIESKSEDKSQRR